MVGTSVSPECLDVFELEEEDWDCTRTLKLSDKGCEFVRVATIVQEFDVANQFNLDPNMLNFLA